MITSAQNTQVKNVIKLNQKAKSPQRAGAFYRRRKKDVSGSAGWLDREGLCG